MGQIPLNELVYRCKGIGHIWKQVGKRSSTREILPKTTEVHPGGAFTLGGLGSPDDSSTSL